MKQNGKAVVLTSRVVDELEERLRSFRRETGQNRARGQILEDWLQELGWTPGQEVAR